MDEALAWARKAAIDPRSRGEVREIPSQPHSCCLPEGVC